MAVPFVVDMGDAANKVLLISPGVIKFLSMILDFAGRRDISGTGLFFLLFGALFCAVQSAGTERIAAQCDINS